jgi:hypothetical protein
MDYKVKRPFRYKKFKKIVAIILIIAMICMYYKFLIEEKQQKACVRGIEEYKDSIRIMQNKVFEITELYEPKMYNVIYWLKFYKIKNPNVAFRQIQLESGNLTSPVFIQNRNCTGMHLPVNRPTTAIGKHGKYAIFSDYVSCIKDYKMYQDYIGVPDGLSDYEYCKYLERRCYWTDENYISKLLK